MNVFLPCISMSRAKNGFGENCITEASTFGLGTKTVDGTLYTSFTLYKLCVMTDSLPRFDVDASAIIL